MNKLIIAIMTLMLLFANTAHAQTDLPSPGILPDNAFYGFKKAFEGIGNAFTFGESANIERALKLAEKRLAEAEAMGMKGKPDHIERLSSDYERHVERAREIAASSRNQERKEEMIEKVSEATSRHLLVLDEVQERVPEQAKARIAAAREASISRNQESLRNLARENPERAAEIAMETAEQRIVKASQAAQRGESQVAMEAVSEYEKYARFGEDISTIAQQVGKDNSKVNELVARATSLHIIVLEEVLLKVPEEARMSIQRAIDASVEGRNYAVRELEERKLPIPEEAREGPPTEPTRPQEIPTGRP